MSRAQTFVPEEYFHVFNRGNSKQNIFRDRSDYERFVATMYLSNTTQHFNVRDILSGVSNVYEVKRPDTLVRIGAYCLMPNHFHFMLSPVDENGLSKFMQKLCTSYSMYFNTKYDRSGSLFEGKFKSKHADSDEYLKYLFSYIHLNPIARKNERNDQIRCSRSKELFEKACAYPYSTLSSYFSRPRSRQDLKLIDTSIYDRYFETKDDVRRELFDWLEFEESIS